MDVCIFSYLFPTSVSFHLLVPEACLQPGHCLSWGWQLFGSTEFSAGLSEGFLLVCSGLSWMLRELRETLPGSASPRKGIPGVGALRSLLLFRASPPYLATAHWGTMTPEGKGSQIFFWYPRNLGLKATRIFWGSRYVGCSGFAQTTSAFLQLPAFPKLVHFSVGSINKTSKVEQMGCACRVGWKEGRGLSFWLQHSLSLRNHIPETSTQELLDWDCSTHFSADPSIPLAWRQFSGCFVLPELMIIRYRHIYCAIQCCLSNSRMDLIN